MNRVNFGHVSAVIVDVCRGHGTFLDRGELHRVVDFVMHGGFDRARQAERESIVEEQRRLRDATLAQPTTTGWSTWNDRGLHALLSAILGRRD